jgi:hypothetical protein
MKRYKPVFYMGQSVDMSEESYDNLKEAEDRIEDRARRSQWDRDDPFDWAEVKIIYVPDEDEEDE